MIAIPNMEKPKSCWECPLYDSEYPWTCDLFDAYCPLIDIVRCGECKYYEESEYIEGDMVCKYHIGHTYYTEADRFCSYGERRTDGNGIMDNSNMRVD